MAKFTNKKKTEAIGKALRNIHILTRAIRMEAIIVKENVNLIADPEDVKAFKEMLNKCNFYTSRMDKLYLTEDSSKKFLVEKNGESAIDELSLRILDAVNKISETFTSSQTSPQGQSGDYGC